MRSPDFWQGDSWRSRLLSPLGAGYALAGALRRRWVKPFDCGVPVLCVGNVVAGGAGKTPVALSLLQMLRNQGYEAHALTRGYGGDNPGPIRVDPSAQDYSDVGDEALLLASAAPTWVAHDRPAGAQAAVASGAKILVMDDGFQNPSLHKTLSLLVIDGAYGFGNGRLLPAGPLREPVTAALKRADAVVLLGKDQHDIAERMSSGKTLFRAHLGPRDGSTGLSGQRVLAFAGIGRPEKFFDSLRARGADLVSTQAFADHHPYSAAEIANLFEASKRLGARLMTTEKDFVRLPAALLEDMRAAIETLPIEVIWQDEPRLRESLKPLLST